MSENIADRVIKLNLAFVFISPHPVFKLPPRTRLEHADKGTSGVQVNDSTNQPVQNHVDGR